MVGMRYSLVSRDLIADCIETMHTAYAADCIISLGGCDKTLPASLMPLARGDALGLTMYGGSCRPGPSFDKEPFMGRELNAGSPYEARGALAVGLLTEEEYKHVECTCIPGAGACGGMFTANTMASCIEALGMSLPNSSSHPSLMADNTTLDPIKIQDCLNAVDTAFALLESGITTRQVRWGWRGWGGGVDGWLQCCCVLSGEVSMSVLLICCSHPPARS
jgi:dihydroxy-acid dehydratase